MWYQLGIISNGDILKIRNGETNDNSNDLAIKTVLELINLCINMTTIRQGATESALNYLITNTNNNDLNQITSLRKRSRFSMNEERSDENGKGAKMVKIEILDEKNHIADNTVTSEILVTKDFDLDDFVEDNFDLDDFDITEEGIVNYMNGEWVSSALNVG